MSFQEPAADGDPYADLRAALNSPLPVERPPGFADVAGRIETDRGKIDKERRVIGAIFKEPLPTLAALGERLHARAFSIPRDSIMRAILHLTLDDEITSHAVVRELMAKGEIAAEKELRRILSSDVRATATTAADDFESIASANEPDSFGVLDGLVTAADVAPHRVEWLWSGFIPRGTVTVVEGDPSAGKTTFLLDLAARLTTGRPMPFHDRDEVARPEHVIYLSYEDSLEVTLRPRLESAGANLSRVHLRVAPLTFPTGIPLLERWVWKTGAALIVIDTLAHALDDGFSVTSHRGMLRVLRLLGEMAERTSCAVVVVRHFAKSGATNPLHRGHGSIGITGTVRSVLQVTREHPDGHQRTLRCVKPFGCPPAPVAYEVASDAQGSSHIQWISCSPSSPAPHTERIHGPRPAQRDAAKAFLLEHLASGPVPTSDLIRVAKSRQISEKTLRRAQRDLGIVACFQGEVWVWHLAGK
jgi:hypothetical protein